MQSETDNELTLFEQAILTERELSEIDYLERLPRGSLTEEQGYRLEELWVKLMKAGLADPSRRRSAIGRMRSSQSSR